MLKKVITRGERSTDFLYTDLHKRVGSTRLFFVVTISTKSIDSFWKIRRKPALYICACFCYFVAIILLFCNSPIKMLYSTEDRRSLLVFHHCCTPKNPQPFLQAKNPRLKPGTHLEAPLTYSCNSPYILYYIPIV